MSPKEKPIPGDAQQKVPLVETIHSYERGAAWIDRLRQHLGEPGSIISPETHPGTVCRTVIYYYPEGITENADSYDNNRTLMIKHTEIAPNRDFRVYGMIVQEGRQTRIECQHVTDIRFPEDGIVHFIDGGDQHFPPEFAGITVTREGTIGYLEKAPESA